MTYLQSESGFDVRHLSQAIVEGVIWSYLQDSDVRANTVSTQKESSVSTESAVCGSTFSRAAGVSAHSPSSHRLIMACGGMSWLTSAVGCSQYLEKECRARAGNLNVLNAASSQEA